MASIEIRQEFLPGEKVAIHKRVGDYFAEYALGDPIDTAKVDKQGTVKFSGLRENEPVWLVGENRHLAAHAKPDGKRSEPYEAPAEIPGELAGQTRPVPEGTTTEGAADTKTRTRASTQRTAAKRSKGS